MEAKINHLNEFEKELEISVVWADVADEYKDLMKQYTKVPVKGFRPGNVPQSLIESTFREEIKEDLASSSSKRFCRKALEENGCELGSPLELYDISLTKNEKFSFKAKFIEMPKFDLPDYTLLDLKSEEKEGKLNEISEKLLEKTTITLPQAYIDTELSYEENPTEEFTHEQKNAASDRVKLMLILKKIAKINGIELSENEFNERIEKLASENDMEPKVLKEFLISNDGMERFTDSILAEMVLEYIIDIQHTN